MGIYQRCLSNFEETPIIVNDLTNESCMNCHSFHNYNPGRMMFHSRGENFAGTFLLAGNKQYRINTKTENATSAGTYPAWHPSGDYIAFSSNTTRQAFHAMPGKKIEVYDLESDLAVWDIKKGTMLSDKRFTTKNEWETFPSWSPDGKCLFFCSALAKNLPLESQKLKYGLYCVAFDAVAGRFEERIDTLLNPEITGKSISFPRISPDGRYLLYTSSGYATFPIWHKEADLEMLDLNGNTPVDIQIANSDEADSYHSWSSNGRWIIFSSRRIDGLYTRLFIAYFDASGRMYKPFQLPHTNPEEDIRLLKSYNIPDFIKGKVELNPYEISRTLNGEVINLNEIIPQK
jgi:dipeptidyl aminopeptidase/acylaminoacyl peptidase